LEEKGLGLINIYGLQCYSFTMLAGCLDPTERL
jgi:hypothetical protein